jgi:hypothetical protein
MGQKQLRQSIYENKIFPLARAIPIPEPVAPGSVGSFEHTGTREGRARGRKRRSLRSRFFCPPRASFGFVIVIKLHIL